jgi:FtsZ-interacting cell division protein ZipA
MSTNGWIVIGIVIAIVAIVGLLIASRIASSRRRSHLQDQFGPEYDRVVGAADSRSDAEDELADRERRHAELELKPLSDASRTRFLDEWQGVQQRFVDDPDNATKQAADLVRRVMVERGYPADADASARAEVVSVDHPDVVQRYRQGCDALGAHSDGDAARTENLRRAMVDFRAVFESLLEPDRQLAGTR